MHSFYNHLPSLCQALFLAHGINPSQAGTSQVLGTQLLMVVLFSSNLKESFHYRKAIILP